jgi:probable rRNA maturation factor
MEILIDNRQKRIDINPDDLQKKTEQILKGLDCKESAVLSIVLVDSAEMADLNYKYRGKEGPTNVLSFSQREGERLGAHQDLLGDVVICTDRCADDALDLGYSNEEMLLYLLIHGILHLHGFDHGQPEEAAAMADHVERIFQELYPEAGSTNL